MTGDPIILPPAGEKSCMALSAALTQAAGTCAPVIVPQIEHGYVRIESAAGTCDPEHMERYMTGGMAMSTGEPSTDTSNWLTISLPPDYRSKKLDLKTPAQRARPTNQGMKNVSPRRKQKRRAQNKQAKAARKKNR